MTRNRAKRLVLYHWWWVASLTALLVLIGWWPVGLYEDWRMPLTLGGLFSGTFLIQKQNLEELRLFRDLFKDFNDQYANASTAPDRV